MAAIPCMAGGDSPIATEHKEGQVPAHSNPKPPIIMNSQSHPQTFPQSDEEPRIRDYAMATALVVAVCAGVAVTFTAIATCHAADDVLKRIFRKGVRHVPR
jgi:hypothetical protein